MNMNTNTDIDTASDIVFAAIRESQREDRIVHLEYVDGSVYDELAAVCDDCAENGDITEFWGGEDDNGTWRIHVTA